jgi:hypothetical protein
MIKKLIPLALLVVAVYITDQLPIPIAKKLPLSKPTPVEQFMRKVAIIESGGNYKVVNEFGMMGKYQFSPSTVRALGFKTDNKTFLNNPNLQDTVMVAYMKANHHELKRYIDRYNGKTFKGIKITRAGILAGAHFAGSGGVVQYFNSDDKYGTVDARGTSVRKYMAYFSNFTLPEV